jgi:hypothetical protein
MKRYKKEFKENFNSIYIDKIIKAVQPILEDPFNTEQKMSELIARGIYGALDNMLDSENKMNNIKSFKKQFLNELNKILK